MLVVKAHEVYLRHAYFQEHRLKRGCVVPIWLFQLIQLVNFNLLVLSDHLDYG